MSSHKFDLSKSRVKRICAGGNRFMVNEDLYPALHNMALATIALKKGGVREPHWHPNATELNYVVDGKAR